MDVPAITINKVCLSGINAIALADQLIRAGEHEIVVAGGMESMTRAPHLLPGSRSGFKYGDTALVDSMAYDALHDQFTDQAMSNLTEGCNAAGAHLTREEQDAFSAQSHQGAAEAWKNGVFDDEVVPVDIPSRKGDIIVTPGRGDPRRHHRRVPVGPASGLQGRHDHRRLRVADLRRRVRRGRDEQGQGRGARPHLARRDRRVRPGRRSRLDPAAPARPRSRRPRKEGIAVSDIDLFELNEAFAAVGIDSARELGIEDEGQRERRGNRPRPPRRDVRCADRAHLALELQRRGGGAVPLPSAAAVARATP